MKTEKIGMRDVMDEEVFSCAMVQNHSKHHKYDRLVQT